MFSAESPVPPSPPGGVLSSRGTTVLPVSASRGGRRAGERGLRWAGVLVAAVGILLLCLAAGDALAGDDALYGGAGDDEIYGGPGEDDVLGGAGDDFIEAKDGSTDRVGCGPGTDSVSVDRGDLVYPDCESVYPG